jgi:hypothetical protein
MAASSRAKSDGAEKPIIKMTSTVAATTIANAIVFERTIAGPRSVYLDAGF